MKTFNRQRSCPDIDVALADACSFGHQGGQRKGPLGFSLVELMIAMAIGLVLLGAVYAVFTNQNKVLGNQEQLVIMQQNARMAMDMMVRDIRMAGSNPTLGLTKCTGTLPDSLTNATCVGIRDADNDHIKLNMDTSDTAGTGLPDGATDGPNETITYGLYTSTAGGVAVQCLGRKTTTDSSYQPVVENIQSLSFTYQDGNDGNAPNIGSIRKITVTLVARAAKYDPSYPQNYGYRTYTLKSQVTPRTLGY